MLYFCIMERKELSKESSFFYARIEIAVCRYSVKILEESCATTPYFLRGVDSCNKNELKL